MSDNVQLRKTSGAYCRFCGEKPVNKFVVLKGRYYENYFLCQSCASLVRDELNNLNISGKILPQPKVDKNKPDEEDLSNI